MSQYSHVNVFSVHKSQIKIIRLYINTVCHEIWFFLVENRKNCRWKKKALHEIKCTSYRVFEYICIWYTYILQLASMWSLRFGRKSVTPVNNIKYRKLCKLKDVWIFLMIHFLKQIINKILYLILWEEGWLLWSSYIIVVSIDSSSIICYKMKNIKKLLRNGFKNNFFSLFIIYLGFGTCSIWNIPFVLYAMISSRQCHHLWKISCKLRHD